MSNIVSLNPNSSTRLERLDVRLTMKERAEIFDAAKAQGLTASEYIRRTALGFARGSLRQPDVTRDVTMKDVPLRDYLAASVAPACWEEAVSYCEGMWEGTADPISYRAAKHAYHFAEHMLARRSR